MSWLDDSPKSATPARLDLLNLYRITWRHWSEVRLAPHELLTTTSSYFLGSRIIHIFAFARGPSLLCRVNLWGRWQEHDWNVPTIPWMTSQHTSLQRDTSYSQQYNMIHQHINTQQPIVQIYHLLTLQGSGWNCVGFFKQCVIHNA